MKKVFITICAVLVFFVALHPTAATESTIIGSIHDQKSTPVPNNFRLSKTTTTPAKTITIQPRPPIVEFPKTAQVYPLGFQCSFYVKNPKDSQYHGPFVFGTMGYLIKIKINGQPYLSFGALGHEWPIDGPDGPMVGSVVTHKNPYDLKGEIGICLATSSYGLFGLVTETFASFSDSHWVKVGNPTKSQTASVLINNTSTSVMITHGFRQVSFVNADESVVNRNSGIRAETIDASLIFVPGRSGCPLLQKGKMIGLLARQGANASSGFFTHLDDTLSSHKAVLQQALTELYEMNYQSDNPLLTAILNSSN